MTKHVSDADAEYARLLLESDKSFAISFLKREADSFINIKHLLSSCKNDKDFSILLPQMLEALSHIRTSKLVHLRKQFHFFNFTARKYLNKLFEKMDAKL